MPKNKPLLIGILTTLLVGLTICASTPRFDTASAPTSALDATAVPPEITQSSDSKHGQADPAAATEASSNEAPPTEALSTKPPAADAGEPSATTINTEPVVSTNSPKTQEPLAATDKSDTAASTSSPSKEPGEHTAPVVPDSTESASAEATQAPDVTQRATDIPEATQELSQAPESTVEALQRASVFAALVNDPVISLGIICLPDLTAQFTIFNDGGDMLTPGQYVVLDNGVSTTHSFQLAAGGSLSFIAGGDSHVDVTYSTSQLPTVSLSAQGNCIPVTPTPTHTSTPTSTPTATGTVTETGTPTHTFTPGDTATNTNTPTATNTRRPTRTPTITPTPTDTPTGTLTPTATNTRRPTRTPTPTSTPSETPTSTLTSTPSDTPTATSTPSDTPTDTLTPTTTFTGTVVPTDPLLSLRVRCQADLTALFTIVNQGGDMLSPGQYVLLTPAAQPAVTISLKQGESISFSGPGNATVELTYSTPSLPFLFLSVQGTCPTSFPATPTNTLTNTPTNTPTNTATDTPTDTPVPANTNTPTPTNTLPPADTSTPTDTPVPANTNTSMPTHTAPPAPSNPAPTPTPEPVALAAIGQCTGRGDAYFTVTNNGGTMTEPQAYQITNAGGSIILSGTIQLAAGESTSIPVSDSSGQVTLGSGSLSVSTPTDCETTSLFLSNPTVAPSAAPTTICGEANGAAPGGFPMINLTTCTLDTSVVQRPAWTPITIGGATCPDWLVYHTDLTGDWELFRLGDLPDNVQADPNLSRGVGPRVFDVMPTTSPDRQWVAFTSNRDGNWEIYLSAVEQNSIRRVTYNTTAIDLDPTWSPVGDTIIYESNRDGQWDLYRFNINTGEETRLTSDPGNDVNAAWSNDGSKITFESDRDGFWQIYELDLTTLTTRRLSDGAGDDHEPQYSNDGHWIVFRSYRDGNTSTLYTMDANGGNVTRISDPAGDTLNAAISPDDRLIAYQSNPSGKNSIYVYEIASGVTRTLTDTTSEAYAPSWWCGSDTVVFTSDVTGDPNLFDASALPIQAKPLVVDQEASQLTFDTADDQYPESAPIEENASRQQNFPSPVKNK